MVRSKLARRLRRAFRGLPGGGLRIGFARRRFPHGTDRYTFGLVGVEPGRVFLLDRGGRSGQRRSIGEQP